MRSRIASVPSRILRDPRACLVFAAYGAALVVAGCASTPPDQDPVQIKLKDLDTRLARVERVVANQSLLDLSNQMESLRGDLRAMHNDVDVLTHNLDAARKQQHDLYADLDQRVKSLESHGGAAGASPDGVATAGGPGTTVAAADGEKAAYQAAFDLLKDGQYDRAVVGFEGFLQAYPASQLADNGQYWLGEAFYVNKQFGEALASFRRVVDHYPDSRKVPDALLKEGFCDYELKDYAAARAALARVTTKYPDAPATRLAADRLQKMAAEGH